MKKYLLFCAAMIAVSGCTLEEVIDRGETCPKDRNGVLSYIQSQDCTAESCNLEGDFSENFQYNVCPKEFPACSSDEEGLYYCSKLACADNQHVYKGGCEDDSDERCDSHDINCNELTGWLSGKCENKKCVALQCNDDQGYELNDGKCEARTSCDEGFHFYAGKCEKDTLFNCGSHGKDCMIKIPGWLEGECTNGECVALDCEEDYNLKNGQCQPLTICGDGEHLYAGHCDLDDLENCGSHGKNCAKKVPGWVNGECRSGECVPTECEEIYEISDDNCVARQSCKDKDTHLYNNICQPNDENNCGSHGNKCSAIVDGWEKGQCTEGVCLVTSCKLGYHIDGIQCVRDSANACGSIDIRCDDGQLCTQGECKDNCNTGEVRCKDKDGSVTCEDPSTSQKFCGAQNACADYKTCSPYEKCVNGICVLSSCENQTLTFCTVADGGQCIDVHSDDSKHCGGCDTDCSANRPSNTISDACVKGQCIYYCAPEYKNCGPDNAPECHLKSSFNSDSQNCGDCGHACGDDEYCRNGTCAKSSCAKTNECVIDGACKNTDTQCGVGCFDCMTKDNASAGKCVDGACVITKCAQNFHFKDGQCVPNTKTECAPMNSDKAVNCQTNSNAVDGYCGSDGTCVATECKENYHIKDGKCEENSITACGKGTSVVNCTELPGWSGGECKNSVCTATKCKHDYCIYNGTCTNGVSEMSTCGVQANTEGSRECVACNPSNEACVNGACKITECAPTVCFLNGESCDNQDTHCGPSCTDCTKNTDLHYVEGSCVKDTGSCKIIKCESGYHLSGNMCIPDSIYNCGKNDYACQDNVAQWVSGICEEGVCKVSQCKAGYHVYDNKCEADSITNCGEHNKACAVSNADNKCQSSNCTYTCDTNYHNYNNGCEVNSADNCGAHGAKCKTEGVQSATCSTDGKCTITACATGYHKYGTICEKDDNTNCGAHGTKCIVANANNTCSGGKCSFTCDSDYHKYGSTCEKTDIENCGTHGNACNVANADNTCSGNQCSFKCKADYHEYNNACEADSTTNCGSHGNACDKSGANNNCSGGTCTFACQTNYHPYDSDCEPDTKDNCGSHGNACNVANANNTCSGGKCSFSCNSNYHLYNNSCEQDSIDNCGTHGTKCEVANAKSACTSKKCTFTCNDNYHPYETGCEADSVTNCGSHGNTCKVDNGTSRCNGGKCTFTCNGNYHLSQDGKSCEPDSETACGAYNIKCDVENATNRCILGGCIFSCKTGFHKYAGKCEKDDNTNCGTHGNACNVANASNSCNGTSCSFTCNDNYHEYNNTCEKDDTTNCGEHNNSCPSGTTCNNGSCGCVGGFTTVTYDGKAVKAACIVTIEDLLKFRAAQANGISWPVPGVSTTHYILMDDIDLGTVTGFEPIGNASHPVKGTFIGNGKTITGNITCKSSMLDCALFGYATSATFDNLNINIEITSNNTNGRVGTLCGYLNQSTIKNCHSKSTITSASSFTGGLSAIMIDKSQIEDSSFSGTIYAKNPKSLIGGIVGGANVSTINNVSFTGDIKYTNSAVDGNCGGIIGTSNGTTIEASSFDGNIDYNASSSSSSVGGLIGLLNGDKVEVINSYAKGNITCGASACGGLIGRGSVLMRTCASFTRIVGTDTVGGILGKLDDDKVVMLGGSLSFGSISAPKATGLIGSNPSTNNDDSAIICNIVASEIVGTDTAVMLSDNETFVTNVTPNFLWYETLKNVKLASYANKNRSYMFEYVDNQPIIKLSNKPLTDVLNTISPCKEIFAPYENRICSIPTGPGSFYKSSLTIPLPPKMKRPPFCK